MDVVLWLRRLGLECYEAAFRDNDIDAEVLPKLTADDLISIGVTSVGHRRKLLAAIAILDAEMTAAAATSAPRDARPPADAERRQLTVMFCDLVGSTALSAQLDPEDLREVIAAYHRVVTDVITGFDGFVAKYMGDGVLVYFGYPRADEADAERAVRAGLGVVDAVGRLNVKTVDLRVRVGIATGLVVVGDLIGAGSAQEQSVVGETPNLAARLQDLAEPGAVVIAVGTRRLVGNLFDYRDLGAIEIRGIVEPVPAWQVLRPSAVESRFEALRGSALSPLVGRDEDIDLLLRRWARAKTGDGQVVLVSGEPGFGKSRITVALAECLHAEPYLRLRYFCSPYHQDSALYPFIDQLARAAGFASDDMPSVKLEKLEALLARAGPPDEDVALLADLMSLPASACHPLPNLSPQRKKERTVGALIRQLEGLACQKPVLIVFEDAHWIDPTSREQLDLTVERICTLPVLLIVTFRPEFHPPWTGQPHVSTMALNRLDRRDRTILIEQIAGGKALPEEIAAQIADHADGVPLFVEELTKSVLESGLLREESDRYALDGVLPPFAVPTTLHDSLMARLDRLASVRLVTQTGAAIGREFSYALLHVVARLPEDELQTSLARLVASELVFQRGRPPDAVYTFKHALVQDAAYGSLLRNSRRQLHAKIAEALETHSPEMMENQPEVFAQHYAEAGLVETSVTLWIKAGQRSTARSALTEAAAQFQRGLDQLALLPDGPERQQQELVLRSGLGMALRATRGLAAPETGNAYARARAVWEQLGSPAEFLHIPYGQSIYHINRGEFDMAQRLAEELLSLSRHRNDSAGLILGHICSGRNLQVAGKFLLSRSHLEAVMGLYNPISHRSLVHQAAFHPHVVAQGLLGLVLFCLGYSDQASAKSNTAVAEARRLDHPSSLALSLAFDVSRLAHIEGTTALRERVDELVAVAIEQGFTSWRAFGTAVRGWINVKDGDVAEGISLLRSGLSAFRAAGSEAAVPHFLARLAAAYEIAGQVEEALATLDNALQVVGRTGEHWMDTELYRHKGELLLRRGQSEAAEDLYRKAWGIAREQGAKLWELRAAVSLARLWGDRGRRGEARALLMPVYGWFTEGFDTADLKEAKALLDELT